MKWSINRINMKAPLPPPFSFRGHSHSGAGDDITRAGTGQRRTCWLRSATQQRSKLWTESQRGAPDSSKRLCRWASSLGCFVFSRIYIYIIVYGCMVVYSCMDVWLYIIVWMYGCLRCCWCPWGTAWKGCGKKIPSRMCGVVYVLKKSYPEYRKLGYCEVSRSCWTIPRYWIEAGDRIIAVQLGKVDIWVVIDLAQRAFEMFLMILSLETSRILLQEMMGTERSIRTSFEETREGRVRCESETFPGVRPDFFFVLCTSHCLPMGPYPIKRGRKHHRKSQNYSHPHGAFSPLLLGWDEPLRIQWAIFEDIPI